MVQSIASELFNWNLLIVHPTLFFNFVIAPALDFLVHPGLMVTRNDLKLTRHPQLLPVQWWIGDPWYLSRQMSNWFFTIAFTKFYGERIEYIVTLVEAVQWLSFFRNTEFLVNMDSADKEDAITKTKEKELLLYKICHLYNLCSSFNCYTSKINYFNLSPVYISKFCYKEGDGFMYEMYETAQQAKYRFLGVDEMYKNCDGWNVRNRPIFMRSLNMNTAEFGCSSCVCV